MLVLRSSSSFEVLINGCPGRGLFVGGVAFAVKRYPGFQAPSASTLPFHHQSAQSAEAHPHIGPGLGMLTGISPSYTPSEGQGLGAVYRTCR